MIGKGVFEFDVNGDKVGFKFGMYAAAITEKESGMSISSLFGKFTTDVSIEVLLYYFFGAYVSYCKAHETKPVNISVFSDYLEEIGLEKLINLYTESLGVYSKNGQAPKESGQTISQ
jgi:hypothetical protein